jgi:hypothetical protein
MQECLTVKSSGPRASPQFSRRSRFLVRAVAYSCPVLSPLLASVGLFVLHGWVALLGLFALWVVFLLCEPSKLEQTVLAMLSWYYLILLVLPVLSMD